MLRPSFASEVDGPAASLFLPVALLSLCVSCTDPQPQPAVCAAYVACYLADDGKGARALADQPTLGTCYATFGGDDADDAIRELSAAYGADGLCWAGGLSTGGAEDPDDVYARRCTEHCRVEVLAECRRIELRLPRACPGNELVEDQCFELAQAPDFHDARCVDENGAAEEGEGE